MGIQTKTFGWNIIITSVSHLNLHRVNFETFISVLIYSTKTIIKAAM